MENDSTVRVACTVQPHTILRSQLLTVEATVTPSTMKDGYRYCYRVVRGECRTESAVFGQGRWRIFVPSLCGRAVCRVTVASLVVWCSRSPLFIIKTEPVIPIHYGTAHSTAHVDDTLGGSALSGMATLRWKQ